MSSRLHRAIVVFLIVAASAGPVEAEQLLLNVKAPAPESVPEAPPASVNLGGGFIEFLLTGRVGSAPRRDALPVQAAAVQSAPAPAEPAPSAPGTPSQAGVAPVQGHDTAAPQEGNVTVVDYSGPFEPGSVILNVTKKLVYRILPDGKMAIYRNDEDQIRLARAILKRTAR